MTGPEHFQLNEAGPSERDVLVLFSMDCEPSKVDVTPFGRHMSRSGPANYIEGERCVRASAAHLKAHGYPITLFLHPEVAASIRNRWRLDLLC